MNLIRAALGELSDLELAYFATFTAVKLAPETQAKIKLYLKERKLDKSKIRTLIVMNESAKDFQNETECCPRCRAEKLNANEEIAANTQWLSYDDILNKQQPALRNQLSSSDRTCKVCSYPESKGKLPKPSVPGIRVFTSSLRS